MKLDKSTPVALNYLTTLLSVLEQIKKENPSNEALTQDIVAQAHIESIAQKMFQYAETQDSRGMFDSKVVKAFYTSSILFDVLSVFGELDENIKSASKFAKWRATYIHTCLKNGEQPVPANQSNPEIRNPTANSFANPPAGYGENPSGHPTGYGQHTHGASPGSSRSNYSPVPQPRHQPAPVSPANFSFVPPARPVAPNTAPGQPGPNLSIDEVLEAKKYVKYALSALDYDDSKAAIENMHKALALLQK
uniref:Vacuolar protein sorting-associated protein VTA1 n=1 Tax=Ditylenchus dipsaci TaxID=166011 RepID=A0A915CRY4_9BILA